MQHLDEGTIHAWLDGALSAEEAARTEAHVAECAQCAAAVAEARGFIAASSRILTALDDAPRGVLPVRRPQASRFGPAWRAAAAVLIVGAGTLAIRSSLGSRAKAADSMAMTDTASVIAAAQATSPEANADVTVQQKTTSPTLAASAPPIASRPAPMSGSTSLAKVPSANTASRDRLSERAEAPSAKMPVGGAVAAPSMAAHDVQLAGVAAGIGCVNCAEVPLRVIRVDTLGIERRTIYEVAANETVTLVEIDSGATGRSSSVAKVSADQRVTATAAPLQMESRRAAAAQRASVPTPSSPPAAAFVAQLNTIEWKDATTGRVLRLSGRLTPERLEEIRKRIERERANSKKP